MALDKTHGNNSIVRVEICVDVDIDGDFMWVQKAVVLWSVTKRGGQRWVRFVTKLRSTMVEVIKMCLI